jgi:hypothetical protein
LPERNTKNNNTPQMKMKYSLACFMAAIASVFRLGAREEIANVALPVGTHETGVISLECETAAITTRYLLVQTGTAPASQFIVNGATTRPLGVVADEPAVGETAAVQLLGVKTGTIKMVASAAITAGALVYTAASGKVTSTISAGVYMVGRALTAAGADGDLIEVAHCVPIGTGDILALGQPAITYSAVTTVAGGALAIPITHRVVNKTITGTEALTLANGAFNGQRLRICCVAQSGGSGTLTPTLASGWSTFVFAIKGQQLDLEWTTAGWIIVGFCYLTTLPVITVP